MTMNYNLIAVIWNVNKGAYSVLGNKEDYIAEICLSDAIDDYKREVAEEFGMDTDDIEVIVQREK